MPRASMPLTLSNTGSSKIKGLNEVNSIILQFILCFFNPFLIMNSWAFKEFWIPVDNITFGL